MLSSPLRSVICVRLWERQDLLLADNFTRQMESGIGSFQILFIDNWAKTNPIILLIYYSGTCKNKIAQVSVSVWNESCDPPLLLPVATPSLQLQGCCGMCIQYLHNFTLSQHETEIYPLCTEGWLLIAPSALYITYINTSSSPCWQLAHRFKIDFATASTHWPPRI